jgi:hypothetical protein
MKNPIVKFSETIKKMNTVKAKENAKTGKETRSTMIKMLNTIPHR